MLVIVQAIVLGIVEGITEFLPISSTGHLIVAEDVMGYHDAAKLFTVVIQLGAIGAVLWYYRSDLVQRIAAFFRVPKSRRFWWHLFIACLPAVAVGLVADELITENAVSLVVAIALIVGGFVLLYAESRLPKTAHDEKIQLDFVSTKQALVIGLSQVTALVPGVSRSGATIVGGMFAGLNRVTAAAFSFYLSIPILIGASGYKLLKNRQDIANIQGGTTALLVGIVAAFVSALIVVSWLLRYISKHDFKLFAYYRIAFGSLVLILVLLNIL